MDLCVECANMSDTFAKPHTECSHHQHKTMELWKQYRTAPKQWNFGSNIEQLQNNGTLEAI